MPPKSKPKRRADRTPISDEIHAALRDDGRTDTAVGHAAGIKPELIRRFRVRERLGLSLATLDRLLPVLGLRLVRSGRKVRPPTE